MFRGATRHVCRGLRAFEAPRLQLPRVRVAGRRAPSRTLRGRSCPGCARRSKPQQPAQSPRSAMASYAPVAPSAACSSVCGGAGAAGIVATGRLPGGFALPHRCCDTRERSTGVIVRGGARRWWSTKAPAPFHGAVQLAGSSTSRFTDGTPRYRRARPACTREIAFAALCPGSNSCELHVERSTIVSPWPGTTGTGRAGHTCSSR